MALIAGIEEAGRGPVIGPMVMAGVLIDSEHEETLSLNGVKDSKKLSPAQRERVFEYLQEAAKSIKIIIIEPHVIDFYVESENKNLNWLEADKTVEIIDSLKPDAAFIDCPSNNINAYSNYLRSRISHKAELHCSHKADERYPVVGAASIIAKVTRDREIKRIKKSVGDDFGSGYPSDPATRRFLEENWSRFPEIFRHSWSSYKAFSEKKSQSRLGDFKK